MTKVAHLISNLDLGGAETMLAKVVQCSDPRRFSHLVISLTSEGAYAKRLRAAEVDVRALGMRRGRPGVMAAFRGLQMLRAWRPDVLQTWLYHADLMGIAGRVVSGAPLLWNIRCSEHEGLRSPTTRICALLSRMPDAIIVNSTAGRRVHERISYRPVRWELIPNGFDTEVWKPNPAARADLRRELSLALDAPLVGLVARADPIKDHTTFLGAAELMAARNPAVHFVLIGDGTDALRFTRNIDHSVAARRVHSLGRRYDLPRLTSALDVATCCSTAEGFPNVVGEAMACGVPCVVTDVGDSAEIVGDTGVVVPIRDPEALAAGWERLLALSDADRRALGAAARQRIEGHYRLDLIVARYEQLWLQVAAQNGSSGTADVEKPLKCAG
jgi:glycosyltransferase involved in cell wall biosynthesis